MQRVPHNLSHPLLYIADDAVPENDQVAAALARIAAHTTSAKKVGKALSLLRQLLIDNKLQPENHGPLCFEVRAKSMLHTCVVHLPSGAAPEHARHSQQQRPNAAQRI